MPDKKLKKYLQQQCGSLSYGRSLPNPKCAHTIARISKPFIVKLCEHVRVGSIECTGVNLSCYWLFQVLAPAQYRGDDLPIRYLPSLMPTPQFCTFTY